MLERDNDPNSLEAWEEDLKPFFPNEFNLACMTVRNKLPYGIPDWLIESTTASFFSMIAYDEASGIRAKMAREAREDPFKLHTVEETNFRTKNFRPVIQPLDLYYNPN